MAALVRKDKVHALVPHTLKEPIPGRKQGMLAGTAFMVKDLFALAGHKISNGNPDWYAHARAAPATVRTCNSPMPCSKGRTSSAVSKLRLTSFSPVSVMACRLP